LLDAEEAVEPVEDPEPDPDVDPEFAAEVEPGVEALPLSEEETGAALGFSELVLDSAPLTGGLEPPLAA
jgi:hypothetical protein